MATAHLTIHEWDTDGEKIKLPKKMKLKIDVENTDSVGQIHDDAMEAASEETGFLILGSTLDRVDF